MLKKAISLFLAAVLLLVAVPVCAVSAEEGTTPEKMLYIKSSAPKELIQRVEVSAGLTYYFTFGLSDTIENFNAVCYSNGGRSSIDANIHQVNKVDKGGSTVYTYSYTIPSSYTNSLIFFGVKASGSTEGYFFGASVYKADDENKTELLYNPNFSSGVLDEWAWGWDAWFAYGAQAGLTEWSNDITAIKVVDYDESLLGIEEAETEEPQQQRKMLYINSSAPKDLIQRAKVQVGKTYYFTFSLSSSINDFSMVCATDGLRYSVNANPQLIEEVNKVGYSTYTYSFTIPETAENGNAMSSYVFFGIKCSGNTEGYLFDTSFYDAEDSNKTELFYNPDFSSGVLDHWAWGWDIWFAYNNNSGYSEWSNDTASLKVVDYDENLEKAMLHVRYESVDMTDDVLVQKLENIEADTEYTISFKYYFASGGLNEAIDFTLLGDDGNSSTIRQRIIRFSESNDYIASRFEDGINAEYKFKLDSSVTETYTDFYTGFYFAQSPRIITEFYISDLSVYKTDDPNKTNLLAKKSFYEMGGWYSYWRTATEGSESFGSNVATHLEYLAEYVPYNEELFSLEKDVVHYGDTNFDGIINLKDLVVLKKKATAGDGYISSFDCNSDEKILADDLVILRKHLVGNSLIEWEESKSSLQAVPNLSGGADKEAATLKAQINALQDTLLIKAAGKVYYISENGKYSNNGLSENTPVTVEKLSETALESGDTVLFKRGDSFRIKSNLSLKPGVSYGAYGSGEKPIISGSLRDYADNTLWTTSDGYLWQTAIDAGFADNIVFNDGEYVGVAKTSLSEANDDGEFYFDTDSRILYLYLRQHNPGYYFDSIEISSVETILIGSKISNVIIENLSLKYAAKHAVNLMECGNVKISGCEIGWVGGAFADTVTGGRYGNGIQFWDKAVGCEVSNNYLYQIFDAALTFQGDNGTTYSDLTYSNNLVEYSSMNFEFWDEASVEMANIDFKDNILRFAGYGFGGIQRNTKNNQAFILGWYNEYEEGSITNFNIAGNIFDVANCRFFYAAAIDMINVSGNTYYQNGGSCYSVISSETVYAKDQASFENAIKKVDSNANAYWLDN